MGTSPQRFGMCMTDQWHWERIILLKPTTSVGTMLLVFGTPTYGFSSEWWKISKRSTRTTSVLCGMVSVELLSAGNGGNWNKEWLHSKLISQTASEHWTNIGMPFVTWSRILSNPDLSLIYHENLPYLCKSSNLVWTIVTRLKIRALLQFGPFLLLCLTF